MLAGKRGRYNGGGFISSNMYNRTIITYIITSWFGGLAIFGSSTQPAVPPKCFARSGSVLVRGGAGPSSVPAPSLLPLRLIVAQIPRRGRRKARQEATADVGLGLGPWRAATNLPQGPRPSRGIGPACGTPDDASVEPQAMRFMDLLARDVLAWPPRKDA